MIAGNRQNPKHFLPWSLNKMVIVFIMLTERNMSRTTNYACSLIVITSVHQLFLDVFPSLPDQTNKDPPFILFAPVSSPLPISTFHEKEVKISTGISRLQGALVLNSQFLSR